MGGAPEGEPGLWGPGGEWGGSDGFLGVLGEAGSLGAGEAFAAAAADFEAADGDVGWAEHWGGEEGTWSEVRWWV